MRSAERPNSLAVVSVAALLPLSIGCYLLAAIVGLFLLADDFGPALLVPLWIVHGVLLALLIRKLGAKESSTYTALFIVITSLMSVYVATMARDDLTLQQRGEKVTATVVTKWRDPAEGRKARDYNYALDRQNGTRVPGPAMKTPSDRYDIGQKVTVLEDPRGELRPRTPGQADATGEVIGSGAFALAALGAVGWMTWRASDAARRRDDRKPSAGMRTVYKAVTGNHTTRDEQEESLREALRTYPADRRGYIKVQPEDYPDLTQHRAARIGWEAGLRAEATGNRGSWRFKETVIEEVPHD
ncbi:hypothetical protein [Streptomyces rhizosphaerihabitans]|uniref:hypothetical protein n=1 Tax=Streptomyces rhizosphaerihabitans TaxID=1266770 RepID=UPI0021C1E491|nr:hypothetical protein [Streptomyces rhizosphaerihabitans]MCT9009400.1 hypothetical protein [Streptomyces rhizosphaerihabitans]